MCPQAANVTGFTRRINLENILKLEDQVVSLELSIWLKEFGVKQESIFYWHLECGDELCLGQHPRIVRVLIGKVDTTEISAFTVAELGEMLPEGYQTYRLGYKWFNDAKSQDEMGWVSKPEFIFDAFETEADDRAKILIHLIETGKLKKEDLC